MEFDYNIAFTRNLGFMSQNDQNRVKNTKIAIAGMGGVGGAHLLTLSRMGFQNFSIADLDIFEIQNFNRQAGAFMSTINQEKVSVMKKLALDINPKANIETFPNGINEENLDHFLDSVDVCIDGLDVFEVSIRRKLFKRCYEKGIPCVTVAPIGMGFSLMTFTKNSVTFEDYFGFNKIPEKFHSLALIIGLSPNLLFKKSLIEPKHSDLMNKKSSSLCAGVQFASAVASSEVLKLTLGRGEYKIAPWSIEFDQYTMKLKKTYNWCGYYNPKIRLMFAIAKRMFS